MTRDSALSPAGLLGVILRNLEDPESPPLGELELWTVQAARRASAAERIRRDKDVTHLPDTASVILLSGLLRLLSGYLADKGVPGLEGGAFFWQEACRIAHAEGDNSEARETSLAQVLLPRAACVLRRDVSSALAPAVVDGGSAESRHLAALAVSGASDAEVVSAMRAALLTVDRAAEPTGATKRERNPKAQAGRIRAYLAQHSDAMGLSDAKLAEAAGVKRTTLIRLMKEHPDLAGVASMREKLKMGATASKRRGSRDGADLEALGKLRRP